MRVQLDNVKSGDYIAFDPTGRDLPDCAEVARVEDMYTASESISGTREAEEDGPYLHVVTNSGERIGGVTEFFAVVWENTRVCKFCGGGVTSKNEETDFCAICFYTGRSQEDVFKDAGIFDLLEALPDARPASAGVWHTGGGCFCLTVSFVDNSYVMIVVGGDASINARPDEVEWSGSFYADEDDDGTDSPLTPEWENQTLYDVIAGIPAVREKALAKARA